MANTLPRRHFSSSLKPFSSRRDASTRRCAAAVPAISTGDVQCANRNVAIFVEPSPFSHISGMKNRFECLIRNLRDQGDDVIVFTPDKSPPKDFHGAKVRARHSN